MSTNPCQTERIENLKQRLLFQIIQKDLTSALNHATLHLSIGYAYQAQKRSYYDN